MSFADDVRGELARIMPEKKCCELAEISGFLRAAGSAGLAGGGKFSIRIKTDHAATARHYKTLLKDYFGIEARVSVTEVRRVGREAASTKRIYILDIDAENLSEQILRETGILMIREGNNYLSDGIYSGIIKSKCCKKAYLRGMFLGVGSMSNPEKGYHLELKTQTGQLAEDLRKLINSFADMECRVTQRRGKHVVYIKKADYIRDILAIMGAGKAFFDFEDVRMKKSVVNEARRGANCDEANSNRSVEASIRQREAISKIFDVKGAEYLPEKLRQVAYLRLEHPEKSLTELAELCEPPMKKSGVNSRLMKLMELARELGD